MFFACFLPQFHTELIFLKGIFQKNGYPKNFIDKSFKMFLNNVHLVKENVPTVEKKAFAPSPSILSNNIFGIITTASFKRCLKFLQTRNCYLMPNKAFQLFPIQRSYT